MPQESIAAYVNNIIAFAIFIITLVFIFGIVFLSSTILSRRTINKNDLESIRINKEAHPPVSYPEATNYKKNPYKQKNIFILGVLFIIIIFFIFLIFAVFNYTRNPSINLNLYLIIGIVFCLILMTMYLVKLKIIS